MNQQLLCMKFTLDLLVLIDNNNNNNNNNKKKKKKKKKNDCLLRLIAAIYRMAELQSYLQNI